jgi:hypothetical protein
LLSQQLSSSSSSSNSSSSSSSSHPDLSTHNLSHFLGQLRAALSQVTPQPTPPAPLPPPSALFSLSSPPLDPFIAFLLPLFVILLSFKFPFFINHFTTIFLFEHGKKASYI